MLLYADAEAGSQEISSSPYLCVYHTITVIVCLQEQWRPQHLQWGGINQLLMQDTPSETNAAGFAESEPDLDRWLTDTAELSQHGNSYPGQNPPNFSLSQSPSLSILSACDAGKQTLPLFATAPESSFKDNLVPDSLLDSSKDSAQWFATAGMAAICKSSMGAGGDGQMINYCCWGPAAPPQHSAMLRGELALAAMSGVAGKSLLKEVRPL